MLNTDLRQRLATVSDMTKGALYMTLAAFFFALLSTLVRIVSTDLPPLEVAFFRNLFALASMLPWILSSEFSGLDTRHFGLHLARAVIGVFAMGLWFTSLALVPLADAVALSFTMPLFIVAGAAAFLGEKVGLRRCSAITIGFVGMLVILQPGFTVVSPVMALPVATAAFWATSALILKHMSATVRAGTSVLYMNLLMTPLSLVPAAFVWTWPHWEDVLLLATIGLLATLAHLALARALAAADASATSAFDYARLPFVALFAFLLFGEVAEIWTWVGAAIIAGSAIYIARRESHIARRESARARKRDTTQPTAPPTPDL
jgi:drug/metabolite transporter (DMT)-like permease